MKRKIALFLLLALSALTPAFAILGIGDVVFDPTNYANALQMFSELEQQYRQLVQTYQQIRDEYEHMVYMARHVPVVMSTRYRAAVTPWRSSSATDTYGTTGGWIQGINSGFAVAAGYRQATEELKAYGSALASLPADQWARLKTLYGTVELADGANLHGMETLGRLRGNAPAVEAVIQGLEDDSLSLDPDMNTEIAVLNKINAASVIGLRAGQDTNKLLVSLAEQQIIEAKRKRDAEAQAINDHIRFRAEGQQVLDSQAARASQAMLAWRMP